MRWIPDRGHFCFESSDRTMSAAAGVLGVTYDGRLTEGFGIEFLDDNPTPEDRRATPNPLTPAERAEIADFMIARWQKWAATGFPGPCEDHTLVVPTRVPGIPRMLCNCGRF